MDRSARSDNPPVVQDSKRSPWSSYACLTLSMALVGLYVGLSPLLVAVFPVMLLAFLRFTVAAVAMAHWLPPKPQDLPLSRRDHVLLALQSLLGNFLFTVFALYGTAWAGAMGAGVVMAGIPACVALLSRLFLREALNPRVWMAAACTAVAVALLALQREASPNATASGDPAWTRATLGYLLLCGAVVCEASYVVIGKLLGARVSPRRISALINLWGLLFAAPMGIVLAWQFDFSSVATPVWALLVFYAIAASMVTVWLWMKGLQGVPAQQAGVFTVFLPLSSAAVGVGLLGESWAAVHAVALGLAVIAVWLVTRPQKPVVLPS